MNAAQAKLDAAKHAEAKALEAKQKADAKVEQLSKDDGGLSDLAAKLEAAKKAAADAATAQQKAEQAQQAADKAVSNSSSNATAKQQAAEQLGKPVAVDQRGKIGAEPGTGHA